MKILKTQKQLQAYLNDKKKLGFVPTMGAIHEGHLSLVKKSIQENPHTLVSIFINPKQFAPSEDFKAYPRDFKKDISLLKKLPVDIFYPSIKDIYSASPDHGHTIVGNKLLESLYCGKTRPHFFRGVLLVVLKFFNMIQPQQAYFGKKDFQQLFLIKEMVNDLNLKVKIRPGNIIRDGNGLALSSRNAYLSEEERFKASFFYKTLLQAKNMVRDKKVKNPIELEKQLLLSLKKYSYKIDYLKVVSKKNLLPTKELKNLVILGAFYVNRVRLIDNLEIN